MTNDKNVPVYFVNLMAYLVSNYPAWKPTVATYTAFWDALRGVDPPELRWALVAHVQRSKWPPSVAEIHALVMERSTASQPTASEAWTVLYKNRHRCDRKREPVWPNEACLRAAQSVRWDDPDWQATDIPTIRAQFERYYKSLVGKRDLLDQHSVVDGMVATLSTDTKKLYGADYKDPVDIDPDEEQRRLQRWDDGAENDRPDED